MNYNKKSVLDADVKGKKVLLRCDFNAVSYTHLTLPTNSRV